MKVTVIIPNYNHASFLGQRIESILNQTYQNFEIIILDDFSPDNSREILEQFRQHPKVSHIIYNEVNSGSTFKQWEKGITLAKGEWIWIAESDDWCEPTLLANLVNGIDENSVIAYCQSVVVYSNGEIVSGNNAKFLEQHVSGKDFINSKMLHRNSIYNASMCIFKRSCYYNINNDYINYKFCGDWLFWINIALQGNVYVSGKFLNFFRKHNKDVSNKAFKNGIFYSEWFKLVDNLEHNKLIDKKTKYMLTVDKFRSFLLDERVDKNALKVIKQNFYVRLGYKVYILTLRSIISKYVLDPLYKKM